MVRAAFLAAFLLLYAAGAHYYAADFKPAGALAIWLASVSAAFAVGRFLTLFAALGLVLAIIYFFLPAGRPGEAVLCTGHGSIKRRTFYLT